VVDDLKAHMDVLADQGGERAFNQRDESRLHALAHGRVWYSEDEDPLGARIPG